MINTTHLLKVTAAWTSIVFAVCFAVVAQFASLRTGFMSYGMHMRGYDELGIQNVATFGMFVSGLIIWNIIALLAVSLFAYLYNNIKQ